MGEVVCADCSCDDCADSEKAYNHSLATFHSRASAGLRRWGRNGRSFHHGHDDAERAGFHLCTAYLTPQRSRDC
eukprot:13260703-Alexandrium_andersonii.AAC.1